MNVTAKSAVPVEMGTNPSQSWKVTPDAVDMTRPPLAVQPLKISAEPENITVDAAKSALLIVDMQNDFCSKGGGWDFRGIDISPNRKPIQPFALIIEALPEKWNTGCLGQLGRAEGSSQYQPIPAARA